MRHKISTLTLFSKKKQQAGRSMVEMLGVLAVVGVLSVMGIYLYSIAVNKYRANEILSEARKRAISVSALIETGYEGEWDDETRAYIFPLSGFETTFDFGVEFAEEALEYLEAQIEIDVYDVPPETCQQMKLMSETDSGLTVMGDCQTGLVTVTFNDDMSDNVQLTCRDNQHCQNNEFCKVTGQGLSAAGGECAPNDEYQDVNVNGLGQVRISTERMTLWAAYNWCHSHHKNLIPVEDFQCYYPNSTNLVSPHFEHQWASAPCLKPNTSNIHVSSCNALKDNQNSFSSIIVNLAEATECQGSFWTASASNKAPDDFYGYSGKAYVILLTDGHAVGTYGSQTRKALCR